MVVWGNGGLFSVENGGTWRKRRKWRVCIRHTKTRLLVLRTRKRQKWRKWPKSGLPKTRFPQPWVSVFFFCPQLWGRKRVRRFYGRLEFLLSFCRKTWMPIKFLVLGGGGIWAFLGVGVPILFLWARAFFWSIQVPCAREYIHDEFPAIFWHICVHTDFKFINQVFFAYVYTYLLLKDRPEFVTDIYIYIYAGGLRCRCLFSRKTHFWPFLVFLVFFGVMEAQERERERERERKREKKRKKKKRERERERASNQDTPSKMD